MAAHALTGLRQAIENSKTMPRETFLAQMKAALELSCWTEEIEVPWMEMHDALITEDIEIMRVVMEEALPEVERVWTILGKPATREAWYKAKYPKEAKCTST